MPVGTVREDSESSRAMYAGVRCRPSAVDPVGRRKGQERKPRTRRHIGRGMEDLVQLLD
jgi:hypothetical protein